MSTPDRFGEQQRAALKRAHTAFEGWEAGQQSAKAADATLWAAEIAALSARALAEKRKRIKRNLRLLGIAIVAVAAFAVCRYAHAADVGLHLATVHAGSIPDPGAHRALWTPGAYAVLDNGITFGTYRNSLSHTVKYPGERYTAYLGWTWRTGAALGPLRDIALTGAAATGYVERVSPLVGVAATIGSGALASRIVWVPHRTQPISLAIERRF